MGEAHGPPAGVRNRRRDDDPVLAPAGQGGPAVPADLRVRGADPAPRAAEPRERIVTAAVAIHDGLAAWPWAAEVLTTDGFIARLGDSFLWLVETILAGVVDAGCPQEQTVRIFRSIWYYTVGEILVRAHTRHRKMDEEDPTCLNPYFGNADGPLRHPTLAAVAGRWAALAGQDTFEQGLRAFVDGLLAQCLAETSGTPGAGSS